MNEVVENVVEQFNKDLSGIFGNRLLDIIIYGSSVRGGFCSDSSDIDFIALIKSELSNDDQMKIQNLHTQYRKSKSIVSLFEGRYIGLENDKVTSGYYVGTNSKGWKPIHDLGFGDLESAMILDSYKAIYKTDLLNSLINFDWNVVYKEISFQLDDFLTNDLLLSNEAYKKYALITAARSLYTYTKKGFISKFDVHDWIKNNYFDIDYGNPIMFLKNVKFEIESFKSSYAYLYHGSMQKGIKIMVPKSVFHDDSAKNVVYLTSNEAYSLFYIWDTVKNKRKSKWVTCWIEDGTVHYEEQFPDQLKTFYDGVSGYVYIFKKDDTFMKATEEDMWVSVNDCKPESAKWVPNVYAEIRKYEKDNKVQIHRYNEFTSKEKDEVINKIVQYIQDKDLLNKDTETSRFIKNHHKDAWSKAIYMDLK